MDSNSSKEYISAFLKERGFLSTSSKRIFVQDCGFYLIAFEIQPMWGSLGLLINLGVKFLWSNFYVITYDYSFGDNRINVPDHPMGALMFDDPNADVKLDGLLEDAWVKITEYLKLQNFDIFLDRIENRNDFVRRANKDHEKRDTDLAIGKMFAGDKSGALEIFRNDAEYNEVSQRLLDNSGDMETFQKELLDIINNCRGMMASKLKIKLAPIESVWNFD